MSRSKMLYLAVCLFLGVTSASAQDLWQYIDLNSDAFTKADMTRADVEAAITAAGSAPVDLSGKQLNRLDLSGIDARADVAGDQAFTFIGGSVYSGVSGELRVIQSATGTTTILGDVDGDQASDLQISMTSPILLANLTAADFVL